MSEQIQKRNPLKVFEEQVALAKGVKDIIKMDLVKERYVATFEGISGRKDGLQVFEQEAFAFIDLANNRPDIMNCDPFSIVAGFIKAATFGLSVAGNDLSIYPRGVKQKDGSYKNVLVVEPQAHGKKRLISRMDNVDRVDEGVLVFSKDTFDFDARNHKVLSHKQTWPRPEASPETVIGCYCTIHYKNGTSRDIVIDANEIKKARSASKMTDGGDLWIKFYGEACKKTVYNRAFKVLYKKPSSDALFSQFEGPESDAVIEMQAEEVRDEQPTQHTQDQQPPANVDTDTGEVTEAEEVKEEPRKETKRKKSEPFV